ncbi:long-chain fatty acid transport protein 1 [Corynespora cassiicola Philippines]|uniref:Very long-chain fatty acid transport protein n=1 Tax=Corynespora cassiicola Philippines TaxID=1448308 RepID=A0A2T2P1P7_CORCC|nr:long-chain fatty acid transport protein 1 [Corynespora cassiicola Philippines]
MAAVATASLAGISALGAYLDGKYHIGQDLRIKRRKKQAVKWYAGLVAQNRLCLWYSFSPNVAKYPKDLCIWSREKQYTWQQTHDRAVQWARFFLAQGVRPGDMVATYLMNSADFLVIWLGLWCIGCAPAMLNYNLKGEGLRHCLKVSDTSICLVDTDQECQERFNAEKEKVEKELGVKTFNVDESFLNSIYSTPVDVPGDEYRAKVTGASPSCLLYTSGTTGLPKAGMYTVARYHERGNPDSLPFGQKAGPAGDRWYCCMPLFHGTGGLSAMGAITGGLSAAVGRKFSVSTFWNDIHDSEATIFVYVGEAARYLLLAPPHPLDRAHPRLRGMYGNGMRPDVWARFKERFDVPEVIEFFNSTEGVFGMAVHNVGPFTENCVGHYGALLRRELEQVYVPVAIDPETGNLQRDAQTGFVKRNSYAEGGEILVKVPSEAAFAGYYNNPSATAKKFERNVFALGDLYYRTGDALRRDDDGRWFFLDRLGDTFRWKSENVSTAEVAEVLGRYPGVGEAMVYGVLVPKHDGRAGCVAMRLQEGLNPRDFDWRSLLAYAKTHLPKYAVPVFARVVRESSKTDNQKQNKAPLREEGIDVANFGSKAAGGNDDEMFWVAPGSGVYEPFDGDAFEGLKKGIITL